MTSATETYSMEMIDFKTCSNCGTRKPADRDHFHINGKRADGSVRFKATCKECVNGRYANDPEFRAKQLARSVANQPRNTERKRLLYQNDAEFRDKVNAKLNERYATDPEFRSKKRADSNAYSKTDAGRSTRRKASVKRKSGYKSVPMRFYLEACPDDQCYWCGCHITEDTRDLEHVMPISLGGEAKPYNETWACRDCNRGIGGKHSKHPLVWIAEKVSESL